MFFVISHRREIRRYFGIKGPAVIQGIKGVEGRLEMQRKLREEIEYLGGKLINEF